MAKPIEPTPPIEGEDARELIDSLKDVASPDEMKRRIEESRRWLAKMMADDAPEHSQQRIRNKESQEKPSK